MTFFLALVHRIWHSWPTVSLIAGLIFSAIHFIRPTNDAVLVKADPWAGFRHLAGSFHLFFDPAAVAPGLFGLFLIGSILCYAFEKTGNLYLSIGLHAGWIFALKTIRVFGDYSRLDLGWVFGATDPKSAMLVLWSTIYASLAEHRWISEVLARRRLMAPSVLDAIEEIHAALRDMGLSVEASVRAYRLMWNFTLGSLLVRAGAGSERTSQQRELRSAPDPDRYPMLAAAATAWTAAHDTDTYRDDLHALIETIPGGANESGGGTPA